MNVHGTAVAVLALAGALILGWLLPGALVVLAAAGGLMTVVWAISVPMRNAGIIDIVWGPVSLLMAAVAALQYGRGADPVTLGLLAMVGLWALRLGIYLAYRNLGKPEDFRYRKFREEAGGSFAVRSLFTIFWLQALLAWVIAGPVLGALAGAATTWGPLQTIGAAVWALGFGWEVVADWQLARFKADPGNRGKVLDSGLWGLSRHPNYFGEAVLWWGIYLFTIDLGGAPFVLGPVLITWMLMKVSGVTMLEDELKNAKPGYRDYIRNTPAFFPGWRTQESQS